MVSIQCPLTGLPPDISGNGSEPISGAAKDLRGNASIASIETIKKRAYGFRNKERFKISITFHCGVESLPGLISGGARIFQNT